MKTKKLGLLTGIAFTLSLTAACSSGTASTGTTSTPSATTTTTSAETGSGTETVVTTVSTNSSGAIDTSDLFSDRDLEQTADLTDAVYYTISDDTDYTITEEGVYVFSGSASEVTIIVDTDSESKVQIVLDGVTITNSDSPAIYVKSADKVFVTTSSDSSLSVTGTFVQDTENDLDAVIYSCDDLVLNGTATLTISSTDTAVKSKDDLKITGGTYNVTATTVAFKAHDSIRIADGTFNITAGTDGFHAEYDDDDSVGYIYIAGGTFNITAGDDAIHATTVAQIDGGTLDITAAEGIEATYVQINGGDITISSSDDGINASQKSNSYNVVLEITGGTLTITMGSGDTDALDSNGNLIISGGTITITTSGSSLDYDGTGSFTGGTLIVNGTEITDLSQVANQMGGGMMQGRGGMQSGTMEGGTMQGGRQH